MGPTIEPLTELERELGLPTRILLHPTIWVAAVVPGRLRTQVNDRHRSMDRDRGSMKNTLNDRQGALGELVGLWLLHRAGLGEPARGLLDLGSAVDLPDLTTCGRPPLQLDVKCHLDDGRKRLFAVNQRACERSQRRGVDGFLPLVSSDLAGRALLGRFVPLSVLQQWRVETLTPRRDPAHVIDLTAFADTYLPASVPPRSATPAASGWGPPVVPTGVVDHVERAVTSSMLAKLRARSWTLDGLYFDQINARLLDLVPPDDRRQRAPTSRRGGTPLPCSEQVDPAGEPHPPRDA